MRFHVRPARILSALMLVAVVNVFVFANGAMTASKNALLGRLVTTSNRPILVNGGEAITGSVIVSGAQLTTTASGFAMVQLDNLGTVSIAPSSTVALNFDAKNVTVKVASGDATVTTVDGVTGTVVGGSRSAAPAGGNSAKNWGIAGVAIGSAGLIWALIAWNKANDAQDSADAANASAASLAAQMAALRACLATQSATSPIKVCTSF